MRNHFHLVVEPPDGNLVEGMRWLLNHRQRLFGHGFSGRDKAVVVEGSGNGYLKTACDYLHLNPVRAHLLGVEERLLTRRGWTEADLAARQRSDPGKLAIAVRLRSETTLPVKWIAPRVQIGATKGDRSLLHHLAPGQRQRKCTRKSRAYAQLEFQSPVRPLSERDSSSQPPRSRLLHPPNRYEGGGRAGHPEFQATPFRHVLVVNPGALDFRQRLRHHA